MSAERPRRAYRHQITADRTALDETEPAGAQTRPATAGGGRTSVSKAMAVLEAFFEEPNGELSLTELSRRVALPKSTVHRLAAELCSFGVVDRVGASYCLGRRLCDVSATVVLPAHRRLIKAAAPALERLFADGGSTVHLGVLSGFDVVYLQKLAAPGASVIPSRVGQVLPASCTGVGKALLAANHFPDVVDAGRIKGPLPRMTRFSIRDPKILASQLRGMAVAGVTLDDGEAHEGVRCVAAPIVVDREPVAAVSVSIINGNKHPRCYVDSVRDAARRIAIRLS